MVNYILLCSVVLSCIACSRTIITGESKSLLTTDKSQDIVVLDYFEVEADESSEHFRIMPGSNLAFLHTYCINNDPAEISKECIMHSGTQLKTDLLVVCYDKNLKAGLPALYRSDSEVRTEDYGVVGPSPETEHIGSLSFDIYNTLEGTKVASFMVTVRTSGLTMKNRRDSGYSNFNLSAATSTIRKCRKKGLKNISKRLI